MTNATQKTINFATVVCVILFLTAYISWILGYNYFKIPDITIPLLDNFIMHVLVSLILFQVNIFFMQITVFGKPSNKKELLLGFIMVPFCFMGLIFPIGSIIVSSTIPLIFFIMVCIYKKSFKKYFWKFILFAIITILYTFVATEIKTSMPDIFPDKLTTIQTIMYSIDLFIFYIFLYNHIQRRCTHYDLENILRQLTKPTKKKIVDPDDIENIDFSKYNIFERIYIISYVVVIQLLQLALVLCVGVISGTFYEMLILIPTLIILRTFILKQTIHSKNMVYCTILTALVFYSIAKISPPLHISLFTGIALTSLFVLILHCIAINTFDIYAMNKTELMQYCQEHRVLDNLQQYVIGKVIEGLKGQQLADYVGCGIHSLEYYSKKARRLLYIKSW